MHATPQCLMIADVACRQPERRPWVMMPRTQVERFMRALRAEVKRRGFLLRGRRQLAESPATAGPDPYLIVSFWTEPDPDANNAPPRGKSGWGVSVPSVGPAANPTGEPPPC